MNDEAPCTPHCPICNDDTPPDKWDGPYGAYRWTPDAPAGVRTLTVVDTRPHREAS